MDFEWNDHRFSGGVLILDLINTVVHRSKPHMKMDRLSDPARFAGFAAAASRFRTVELEGRHAVAPATERTKRSLLTLREAADTVFRMDSARARTETPSARHLQRLFSAAAAASKTDARQDDGIPLGLACSLSAMRLIGQGFAGTVRACPNCDWLFLDRSKNRARRWCDMAVCGNRAKAARHYKRRKSDSSA